MAVNPDRAVFWYGCNMTRHGEIVRNAARLLDALGVQSKPAGGPGHCCGAPKEASARIAEGMGRRTVEAFNATGLPAVVTWCPSCHLNMQDSMAPVTAPQFDTMHITEVVHAARERLRPMLRRAVPTRMLLHAHLGFSTRVPVNRLVTEILAMVPGLELVADPPCVPGHMCSALAGVKGALADAHRATLAAMAAAGADTLCTIFHSCHREAVTLERQGIRVVNWIHVLSASLGWAAQDEYKLLRNVSDPRAELGPAALEAVGEVAFERLIEPELRRAPPV